MKTKLTFKQLQVFLNEVINDPNEWLHGENTEIIFENGSLSIMDGDSVYETYSPNEIDGLIQDLDKQENNEEQQQNDEMEM